MKCIPILFNVHLWFFLVLIQNGISNCGSMSSKIYSYNNFEISVFLPPIAHDLNNEALTVFVIAESNRFERHQRDRSTVDKTP